MYTANFTIVEGRKYAIPYTMTYSAVEGEEWIDELLQGEPIQRSEVTNVFFHMKRRATDTVARLTLSDAEETEIEWVDEAGGEILVHLNENTEGFGGYNDYELTIKFPDGSYTSMDIGKIYVIESVGDTP